MQVRMSQVKPLVFRDGDGKLSVHYDNRGEPFREGVEIEFDREDGRTCPVYVLLDRDDVERFRNKLNEFLASK